MRKQPDINSLVVFNHLLDAAVFRVKRNEGFRVHVVDRAYEPHGAVQVVDRSMCRPLSIGQIKELS